MLGCLGHHIKCDTCDGKGMRTIWSFGVKEPDECPDCGGSGLNWLYPHGAIARYYAGPLIGRVPTTLPVKDSDNG